MNKKLLQSLLDRPKDSNKYDFGHVLIVGGSPGMVGAPLLSAMAALRIGSGLVTIGSSADVIDKLEKRVVEVMTLRLSNKASKASDEFLDFVQERRVSDIVFGPGMNDTFTPMMKQVIPKLTIPIIIDAGAVVGFKNDLEILTKFTAKNRNIILTPHDGEFERLTGTKLPQQTADRTDVVKDFAIDHGITLISKGNPTIVSHADGTVFVNTTGNPGLSTAGTGDVLNGVIAGLIAQSIKPYDAAEIGVFIHGLSADLAVKEKTQLGLIASDVVEYLSAALMSATSEH